MRVDNLNLNTFMAFPFECWGRTPCPSPVGLDRCKLCGCIPQSAHDAVKSGASFVDPLVIGAKLLDIGAKLLDIGTKALEIGAKVAEVLAFDRKIYQRHYSFSDRF